MTQSRFWKWSSVDNGIQALLYPHLKFDMQMRPGKMVEYDSIRYTAEKVAVSL